MSSHPGPLAAADAFSIRDQVVILTGATGRVGRGMAEAFAANGSRLVVSDRDTPDLWALAERLTADTGASVIAHATDLRDPAQLRGLVNAAVERFGGINHVVHCGAVPSSKPLVDETEDDFDRLFHSNLRSMWLLAKYAAPHLEATSGSMVGIASVNGHRALFPCSLYGATKAGMINMSRELAAELGEKGIRFNTISPGVIRRRGAQFLQEVADQLHPGYAQQFLDAYLAGAEASMNRTQPLPIRGEAYDVAMAAIYLMSPAARFVSGADLLVDGGKLHMFEHQIQNTEGRGFWRGMREHLRSLPDEAWKGAKPDWLDHRR